MIFLTDFCRANEGVSVPAWHRVKCSVLSLAVDAALDLVSVSTVIVSFFFVFFSSHKLNIFGTTIMWIIFWSRFEELSFIWAFIAAVDVINSWEPGPEAAHKQTLCNVHLKTFLRKYLLLSYLPLEGWVFTSFHYHLCIFTQFSLVATSVFLFVVNWFERLVVKL